MLFAAKARPITRQGLAAALEKLGMAQGQTAALWAVFEVETSGVTQGFGFRPDKRPQILFERHKFREFTNAQFTKSNPDLSGPQGAYGLLAAQYPKLERALNLCAQAGLGEEPALKSASWGIGQVMGFNHEVAGFATAKMMVEAMIQSEDAQLEGVVGFLLANRLDQALRTQNWSEFALKYNGATYAANQYDVKLEQAYARFSSGSTPDIELRTAQSALFLLGYSVGKIDGVMGSRTRAAIKGFQIEQGLAVTGELGGGTFPQLWEKVFA